jgi:methionine-rich copper-binding protein CopC
MVIGLLAFVLLSQANIQLDRNANGENVVRIVGGAAGTVSIHVATARTDEKLPSVLGTTAKAGNDLIFTPRFPFEPGRAYRVEFSDGTLLTRILTVPESISHASTRVVQIYPTTAVLPANQLKLYLQFSAPMSRGSSYSHIRLLDSAGREIEHAFLELGEELWDHDQTRFTLLFDPGRIKRDLVPNLDDGTPLQAGRRYTLQIDAGWPDARGSKLSAVWNKDFTVVAADRTAPDPMSWRLAPPAAGTSHPLVVNFPEPMDYGLLLRTLRVVNRDGTEVSGSIVVDDNEKRWVLTPASEWVAGDYSLQIDASLEDLAGNRIGRLFEVDTRTAPESANGQGGKNVSLSFSIGSQRRE